MFEDHNSPIGNLFQKVNLDKTGIPRILRPAAERAIGRFLMSPISDMERARLRGELTDLDGPGGLKTCKDAVRCLGLLQRFGLESALHPLPEEKEGEILRSPFHTVARIIAGHPRQFSPVIVRAAELIDDEFVVLPRLNNLIDDRLHVVESASRFFEQRAGKMRAMIGTINDSPSIAPSIFTNAGHLLEVSDAWATPLLHFAVRGYMPTRIPGEGEIDQLAAVLIGRFTTDEFFKAPAFYLIPLVRIVSHFPVSSDFDSTLGVEDRDFLKADYISELQAFLLHECESWLGCSMGKDDSIQSEIDFNTESANLWQAVDVLRTLAKEGLLAEAVSFEIIEEIKFQIASRRRDNSWRKKNDYLMFLLDVLKESPNVLDRLFLHRVGKERCIKALDISLEPNQMNLQRKGRNLDDARRLVDKWY